MWGNWLLLIVLVVLLVLPLVLMLLLLLMAHTWLLLLQYKASVQALAGSSGRLNASIKAPWAYINATPTQSWLPLLTNSRNTCRIPKPHRVVCKLLSRAEGCDWCYPSNRHLRGGVDRDASYCCGCANAVLACICA